MRDKLDYTHEELISMDKYDLSVLAMELQIDLIVTQRALSFNHIAEKLSLKEKPFICIAVDEPYFMEVFDLIKKHEQSKNKWFLGDEEWYHKMRLLNETMLAKAKMPSQKAALTEM